MTNHHVVDGADRVIVQLSDRREYDAEVIGTDQRSDLALLQVEADDLPFLTLGKSADLKVGQWVLAIGSPFGLDYSVTAGIVSAKGRSLPTERGEIMCRSFRPTLLLIPVILAVRSSIWGVRLLALTPKYSRALAALLG